MLASCAPAPASLSIQLRTDLAPGREFDLVTLVVSRAGMPDRTFDVPADTTRNYGRPVRLTEIAGLDEGGYRVTATVRRAGNAVQIQPRHAEVRGPSVVTIVVTRDCAGVMCPTAGDPSAEACLGGRCVDPSCGDPGAPVCGTECTVDADCPASSVACVTPRCTLGICFAEADDTTCMSGDTCDTALGCGGQMLAAPILRVPTSGLHTGSPFDADIAHPASSRALLVRWDAVAGATEYQLQVDDSCDTDAYESCTFPSPEQQRSTTGLVTRDGPLPVSLVSPVGARYFVRVRACVALSGTCGPYSRVRYVDVGRQRTDFDGDGYADVAVGMADVPPNGAAYVHRGSAAGASATPLAIPGPTSRFGFAMVAGDFEGNGLSSLAVSAEDLSFQGTVYVVAGFQGGAPSIAHTLTSPLAPADQSFGVALAAGDLDADGYDDLAIGAPRVPGSTSRAGAVFVYRGGPSATWSMPSQTLMVDDAAHGGFGRALAIGDLDGDGVMDLAVGAPDVPGASGAGPGIVRVFLGHVRGALDATPSWTFEDPTGSTDAQFGAALAIGDLSGDGIGDLVIGAPQERVAGALEGAVYRVDGGSTTGGALVRIASPDGGATFFGRSVDVVRALSADERGALAIGAPFYAGGDGRTYIAYGGTTFGLADVGPTGGQLGWAVANVGDVNGDGLDELASSAPMGSGAGHVVLRDGDVAISAGASLGALDPGTATAMGRFGWSIAH